MNRHAIRRLIPALAAMLLFLASSVRAQDHGQEQAQAQSQAQPQDHAQDPGWDAFGRGDIEAAAAWSQQALEDQPDNQRARHLRILTSFLSGRYEDALAQRILLPADYAERDKVLTRVILDTYLHLHRFAEASAFARAMELPEPERAWLDRRAASPPTVHLERTTILRFAEDNFLGDLMPAVEIEVNGVPLVAHLDTGGAFLTMSTVRAQELGIAVRESGRGVANNQETKVSRGIAASMRMGDAEFTNVQVSTVETLQGPQLEKIVILGTSVLSYFLVTWDNEAGRLVLSPRGDQAASESHLAVHAADADTLDFYLHSDHHLWVRGTVAGNDTLMFLDTGLVTLDPRGKQPAGGIVPQRVQEWGLATAEGFTESVEVSVGPVSREVSSFSVFEDGRNLSRLGDLGPDVLISHGFFKNYVWTLDFDTRKLHMRPVSERPTSTASDSPSGASGLEQFAGSYEVAPGVNLEVSVGDDGLLLQAPGQQRVPMTRGSEPDTFEIALAGATVVFGRAGSGEVVDLVLRQGGNETRARKL